MTQSTDRLGLPDEWRCVIVCSCGDKPRRIATVVVGCDGFAAVRGGPVQRGKGPTPQILPDRPHFNEPEVRTTGRVKFRWRCPRCHLDLALSGALLQDITVNLRAAGVARVEFSALVAIVSGK